MTGSVLILLIPMGHDVNEGRGVKKDDEKRNSKAIIQPALDWPNHSCQC